jgi:transposase
MNQLRMAEHLSEEEVEKRYRNASEGVERSQWQIIWLLVGGKTTGEVEAVTGYSLTWIREIAGRYNRGGAKGIGDKRHGNPGRAGKLSAEQDQALVETIAAAQTRGENWNGRAVAAWMSEQLGQKVYMQRGYEWLAKHKQSPQVPRPSHHEANPAEQEAFKKSSRQP